jgi:hypothetical protein
LPSFNKFAWFLFSKVISFACGFQIAGFVAFNLKYADDHRSWRIVVERNRPLRSAMARSANAMLARFRLSWKIKIQGGTKVY